MAGRDMIWSMFYIDSNKCSECGACVDVCPQRAISIQNDVAVINQGLCSQCGNCVAICPTGAIYTVAPIYAQSGKGGDKMRGRGWFGWGGWGRGIGRGFRGGMGFGFRGSSPPWPYVGLGRGGLPRCDYFLSGAAGAPATWPYQQAPYPASPGYGVGQGSYPPYAAASPTFGNAPFAPQVTPEQELDFLKNQAQAIKGQLEQIEARMRELETK